MMKKYIKKFIDSQLIIADKITAFAGSMKFVYISVAIFGIWMIFVEKDPWPTLTLVVSLEAIFLSTFVMIGQNRLSAIQQKKTEDEFHRQETELEENTHINEQIYDLAQQIHDMTEDIQTKISK
jgi:uncharacterized membrane protein